MFIRKRGKKGISWRSNGIYKGPEVGSGNGRWVSWKAVGVEAVEWQDVGLEMDMGYLSPDTVFSQRQVHKFLWHKRK